MEFDHQQAVRTHAVERYLLDELPSPLREEFEDHFFSCPQCAEALRTGTMLRENVRALLRARPQSHAAASLAASPEASVNELQHDARQTSFPADSPLGWRTWFQASTLVPWAAAFLFLCVAVWQRQAGSGGRYAAVMPAFQMSLHSDSRSGAADSAAVLSPASPGLITLLLDVPADGSYQWSLRPRETATSVAVPPLHSGGGEARGGVLAILVDSHQLPAGSYVFAVRSSVAAALPDRLYPFVLKVARQ